MTTRVRQAGAGDLEPMVATLVASHRGYAWEKWAMPDAPDDALAALYRIDLARVALPHGVVDVVEEDGHIVSVAVWVPTGVFARLPDDVLDALDVVAASSIGERLALVDEVEQTIRSVRPRADWYLATMGTRPEVQGHGFGSLALQPMLARLDHESATAVLETSDARNVRFYERAGFEVAHHLTALPHAAPAVWILHRVHVVSDTT